MKSSPLKKIQTALWKECKRIIHNRYQGKCYTCGKIVKGKNKHTGHMIPKKYLKAYLKYDLRLLRPQCYHCNINLGGMGALFIEKMRKIEGNDYVNTLLQDLKKARDPMKHYEKILKEYKETKI